MKTFLSTLALSCSLFCFGCGGVETDVVESETPAPQIVEADEDSLVGVYNLEENGDKHAFWAYGYCYSSAYVNQIICPNAGYGGGFARLCHRYGSKGKKTLCVCHH